MIICRNISGNTKWDTIFLFKDLSYASICHKIDILAAITDVDESRNLLSALPTGFGKTLPQLLVSSLSTPGLIYNSRFFSILDNYLLLEKNIGGPCFVIPPLTVILDQLAKDCENYGISYVDVSKVQRYKFKKSRDLLKGFFLI